jgi:hypothetical protein
MSADDLINWKMLVSTWAKYLNIIMFLRIHLCLSIMELTLNLSVEFSKIFEQKLTVSVIHLLCINWSWHEL